MSAFSLQYCPVNKILTFSQLLNVLLPSSSPLVSIYSLRVRKKELHSIGVLYYST